jgi:hypothetical protein
LIEFSTRKDLINALTQFDGKQIGKNTVSCREATADDSELFIKEKRKKKNSSTKQLIFQVLYLFQHEFSSI